MDKTIIFSTLYNPDLWESVYGTISLHKSKEGAEKAIAFHKTEKIKEWKEQYPNPEDEPHEFNWNQGWSVGEEELLD